MGLDQYIYAARDGEEDLDHQRQIAYRRKHPNLHGWMEKLYQERTGLDSLDSDFNGVEIELTWEDLDRLETDIKLGRLPKTTGFFFGEDRDQYYREDDLNLIKQARSEIFCGFRVFYYGSW